MKKAPTPESEAERQARLDDLQILDTPAEERFDRVTRLARRLFQVPIALISLVDRERQWFKSAQGLNIGETSREVSFCGHAILGDETMIVPDASRDERFWDNPLVTSEPHIRFYAGEPLSVGGDNKVGTLCLIDTRPRTLSETDRETLRDLASIVESELRLARLSQAQMELVSQLASAELKASVDSLTRIWNRDAIFEVLRRELSRAERGRLPLAVVLADLDDFKEINDEKGHPVGDDALRAAAQRLREALRPYDAVGRYGGEEFMAVLIECDRNTSRTISNRICRRVAERPVETREGPISLTVSLGVATYQWPSNATVQELVEAADDALYQAKRNGKNRVEYAEE